MNDTITISQELLSKLIAKAFKRGKDWGVTYSTWFTPTEEDTAEKINDAIAEAQHTIYTTIE